jgi:hypothetical protein
MNLDSASWEKWNIFSLRVTFWTSSTRISAKGYFLHLIGLRSLLQSCRTWNTKNILYECRRTWFVYQRYGIGNHWRVSLNKIWEKLGFDCFLGQVQYNTVIIINVRTRLSAWNVLQDESSITKMNWPKRAYVAQRAVILAVLVSYFRSISRRSNNDRRPISNSPLPILLSLLKFNYYTELFFIRAKDKMLLFLSPSLSLTQRENVTDSINSLSR